VVRPRGRAPGLVHAASASMTSPYLALADYLRQAGDSPGGSCYECTRRIGPRNRRRGAWCERCELESDDGLGRNGAASTDPGRSTESTLDTGAIVGPSTPRPGGLRETETLTAGQPELRR
jgi:hypothetical protein